MKRRVFGASMAALITAGCATYGDGRLVGAGPEINSAVAELRDASGRNMGTATLTQAGEGIRLSVEGMNLPSGAHGIHVHQTGLCAAPDFSSAGPHWNPGNRQHGRDNPAGMHSGDLPNILIGANGQGMMEYMIPSARLSGGPAALLDEDGAALVVHAGLDDYRTDPSGNSGGRIACGVFR